METPADPYATSSASAGDEGIAIPEFLRKWDGLRRRVMSAAIMSTLVLFAVMAGGIWFYALIILAALQMVREWDGLTGQEQDLSWKIGGLLYAGIPGMAMLWLRDVATPELPNAGMLLALYLLFVIVATDTAAYFTGKRIGGPKLAPVLSPSKTWAGLAGGVAAAGVVGGICASFTPYPYTFGGCIWTAMFLAVVAQAGDLFESWLKRRAGMKDSGALIPGHGGLLDRVDGVVTAAPVFAIMVAISG